MPLGELIITTVVVEVLDVAVVFFALVSLLTAVDTVVVGVALADVAIVNSCCSCGSLFYWYLCS